MGFALNAGVVMDKNMSESAKKIRIKLSEIKDPHTHQSIVSMGCIKIRKEDMKLLVIFTPTSPFCPAVCEIIEKIHKALKNLRNIHPFRIIVENHILSPMINRELLR